MAPRIPHRAKSRVAICVRALKQTGSSQLSKRTETQCKKYKKLCNPPMEPGVSLELWGKVLGWCQSLKKKNRQLLSVSSAHHQPSSSSFISPVHFRKQNVCDKTMNRLREVSQGRSTDLGSDYPCPYGNLIQYGLKCLTGLRSVLRILRRYMNTGPDQVHLSNCEESELGNKNANACW